MAALFMTRMHLLTPLQQALDAFAQGTLTATALSETARAQTELLAALPQRYSDVLLGLLDRLESSALFTEESCSFSHKDLLANLLIWMAKARDALDTQT